MSETFQGTVTTSDGTASGGGERSPAQLLWLFSCDRPFELSSRHLLDDVDEIAIGRGERRGAVRTGRLLRLDIDDRRASTEHLRISRAGAAWHLADAGSKNGTVVNGARRDSSTLADGDLLEIGHTFFLYRAGAPVAAADPLDTRPARPLGDALSTLSLPLARRFDALGRVARGEISILVTGRPGTGKELVARAVHTLSGRRGDLVAVNCGALPENLVEAELFGFQRGSFSGAHESRVGLVRSADGGTLFLDEIGDLPAPSQAALLRVLQEREVHPIGAVRPTSVDVRVVAATHRDLPALVASGAFREDLLSRLRGFTLALPPLAGRPEDRGILIAALLTRQRAPAELTFTRRAARALLRHDFALNIRELEQTLASALALAPGPVVGESHLPDEVRASLEPPAANEPSAEDLELRARLATLLEEHEGNVSAVARALGKERTQVHRWLRRLRIDLATFRR